MDGMCIVKNIKKNYCLKLSPEDELETREDRIWQKDIGIGVIDWLEKLYGISYNFDLGKCSFKKVSYSDAFIGPEHGFYIDNILVLRQC